MIKLVNDTIEKDDIDALCEWLQTNPRLTKGELTKEFEDKWSDWLGVKHSIFVNSGSSANLAMVYALQQTHKVRWHGGGKIQKVVVPAVSWVTTVSPIIQLGMTPILCEVDKQTLGISLAAFEEICKREKPDVLILVHVLGVPSDMDDLCYLCRKYNVILLEDSCESVGTTYKGIKTGAFGFASSFSFYYGHHMSTIEGGMVCTNDKDFANLVRAIRAHGWGRDLIGDEEKKKKEHYRIDDFKSLYTFYYPGFNLRSTDLQAFIGLRQLEKVGETIEARNEILKIYDDNIENDYWKLDINRPECFISNFAYPIIHPKIASIVAALNKSEIETRPLICGSIGRQPFWCDLYGTKNFLFADKVHDQGLYLPNNPQLEDIEFETICEVVNEAIK